MLACAASIALASPALADGGDLAAYLRARAADADGRVDLASAAYARALDGAPTNPLIAIRAYREALASGDDALAVRAGAILDRAGVAPADAALIPLAIAARRGDDAGVEAAIARLTVGPLGVLAPALRGWAASVRGADYAAPLATATEPVGRRFATEMRALILIARGPVADGMAALRALGGVQAPVDLRIAAAQLLIAAHHDAEARTLLAPGDPSADALRGQSAKPTLGFGGSRLLVRVASDLATGKPSPLSITLTRAALIADPDDTRARLLLADALSDDGAPTHALATLDAIPATSPYAVQAAAARVAILQAAARPDDARAAAETLATRGGAGTADWQRYADLLLNAGKPAEAATWYARIIGAGTGGWTAWLQYGAALDQAGRWAEARPALERAVALAPDQPLALNYLGYARIEHGEDVAGATRMLARASLLKPGDGSIADSLGWAYYRQGELARALPLIQRAAEAEPTNAEIGEHLGDLYWTLGRRYEARYAWRSAVLTADADDAARLKAKLATGLTGRH